MALTATTVALAGLALAAVGTGVGVYSSIQQGEAAEDAAEYNAEVAENNAKAQQQQAAFDADRLKKRQLILLGKQRAAFAKSGVDLSGSATDVMYDSELEGELDRLAVLYTGNVASGNLTAKAKLERMSGRNAKQAGYLNAGGTLLTGAGNAAQAYGRIQTARSNPSFEYED